jgi:hypothetical protein
MPEIWTAAKQLAFSQYLLTVTTRYVAACDCSSCHSIRVRFEGRWNRDDARRQHGQHP